MYKIDKRELFCLMSHGEVGVGGGGGGAFSRSKDYKLVFN